MAYNIKLHLRVMGAFFMGFIAGVSFIATILPLALTLIMDDASPLVQIAMNQWTVPAALVWGVCTGAMAWFGKPGLAIVILAGCGVVSGGFAASAVQDSTFGYVLTGGVAGLLYGGGAGILLGKLFRNKAS